MLSGWKLTGDDGDDDDDERRREDSEVLEERYRQLYTQTILTLQTSNRCPSSPRVPLKTQDSQRPSLISLQPLDRHAARQITAATSRVRKKTRKSEDRGKKQHTSSLFVWRGRGFISGIREERRRTVLTRLLLPKSFSFKEVLVIGSAKRWNQRGPAKDARCDPPLLAVSSWHVLRLRSKGAVQRLYLWPDPCRAELHERDSSSSPRTAQLSSLQSQVPSFRRIPPYAALYPQDSLNAQRAVPRPSALELCLLTPPSSSPPAVPPLPPSTH